MCPNIIPPKECVLRERKNKNLFLPLPKDEAE
jgi:hypothetical protein